MSRLGLVTVSHSPLFGINDPGPETIGQVKSALNDVRAFVREFRPDITIVFGPDHFNGVFYDMMPAFCIGSGAISVGDWGTKAGALHVNSTAAKVLIKAALDAGIDVAQSERLHVDHGIAQPLEFLFGAGSRDQIIPIFVNAVGLPLGPMERVRKFGEAIGRELARWDKRILLVGSGGLSHDPPVPRLEGASAEIAARLIDGRNPTPEARAAREERVIAAGRAHAVGDTAHREINPEFDGLIMDTLSSGQLTDVDTWSNDWMEQTGGHSAHEIRAWIAAFAALAAAGSYRVTKRCYWPVKEWMTGFGIMTAVQVN